MTPFTFILTQETGWLSPIAKLFGFIMNALYEFQELFGIQKLAVCIVLFTIVTKMIMLPLQIKQQKSTKLQALISPEIAEVQKKYEGKKDTDSMRMQQEEIQAVYDKYGTNMMSGCLPLLITLPVIWGMYRVIYAVPAYVHDIYEMYASVAKNIMEVDNYATPILYFVSQNNLMVRTIKQFSEVNATGTLTLNHLIDTLYAFNTSTWEKFQDVGSWIGSVPAWLETANTDGVKIMGLSVGESLKACDASAFTSAVNSIGSNVTQIVNVNGLFAGLNILDNSGWKFPGVIIPLASGLTTILQTKLVQVPKKDEKKKKSSEPDPTAQTMKAMNYFMPIMSIIFCAAMPICVGIYWVFNSVISTIQSLCINKYIDKVGVDAIIAKNVEKLKKKREKYGIVTGNQTASVAKQNTKNIEHPYTSSSSNSITKYAGGYKNNSKNENSSETSNNSTKYKAGSISSYANYFSGDDKNKKYKK